jgi:hypothetical protein
MWHMAYADKEYDVSRGLKWKLKMVTLVPEPKIDILNLLLGPWLCILTIS